MQIGRDQIHGLDVMNTHQINPKPIDVILLHPMTHGLQHEFPKHRTFASGLIATCGCIGKSSLRILAVIVAGHQLVEIRLFGQRRMVVDYIHDDPDPFLVQRLYQLLEFVDPHRAIVRIR